MLYDGLCAVCAMLYDSLCDVGAMLYDGLCAVGSMLYDGKNPNYCSVCGSYYTEKVCKKRNVLSSNFNH